MQLLSFAIRLVALSTLLWLAVIDVRSRRLPTKLVLPIGVLFFADALVLRISLGELIVHLAMALVVFLVCAGLFAAKMLGGGDAKLAAMIFLWAGLNPYFGDRDSRIPDQSCDTKHGPASPLGTNASARHVFERTRRALRRGACCRRRHSHRVACLAAFDSDAIGRRPYVENH